MKITQRVLATVALLTLAIVATAQAHTMFLKLDTFFLEPNSTNVVQLINGEFDKSENAIARDRMLDVSVVGPGGVVHPPTSAWRDSAVYTGYADSIDTALLTFETGAAGTYLLAVSTAPTVFTLTAQEFNDYLEHDGIVDAIEQREAAGKTNEEATERYSKHVKAIVQVGDARTDQWSRTMGYPAEFVPLQNPYALEIGDELEVRFLHEGEPVANQLIYANHEYNHAHDETGAHIEAVTTRTNRRGVATIPISAGGRWYIRAIHMFEPTEPAVDYESNWATLTFEIDR